MMKTTQRDLRAIVATGRAKDITNMKMNEFKELKEKEVWFNQIAYANGVYGCNGQLLKGHTSGELYAVTKRTAGIYFS